MKTENLSKQMVVFHKIGNISHDNAGIMQILKSPFNGSFFVNKLLTFLTLICNQNARISSCSKSWKNQIYLQSTYTKCNFIYFCKFWELFEGFFLYLTANGTQNIKFCDIVEIWK